MHNKNGFTLIEGLIVTVAVALVGFAGYSVWQVNSDDTQLTPQPNQDERTTDDVKTSYATPKENDLPYVCRYEGLTEIIDNGIENNSNNQIVVSSSNGLNSVRSEPDVNHGYDNVEKLYVNNNLIFDSTNESQYEGDLFPLFWSEDESTLYLRTKIVANHGHQDSVKIYRYTVSEDEIKLHSELEGAMIDTFTLCNMAEQIMVVSHANGGGFESYTPPHRISTINLSTGEVTELVNLQFQSLKSFENVSFLPDENKIGYTIKKYLTENDSTIYYDSDLEGIETEIIENTVRLN